ncbi:hypothetical protein WCT80_20305 [Pectobacterium carotovorum]|uniref:hypothetical protein n=1 Tax=Pectobacterium carotovorum TaxID=554 RepID=UPI0030163BB3
MLIELINTRNINLDDTQIEACIQNILCSYREGKHIIIADEPFLKELAAKTSLGSRNCNAAQNILQKIKELVPIKNKTKYYCRVDMSSNSTGVIRNELDECFFVVGYQFFNDSSKIQLTKLLCEDINDYKIYKIIAEHFKHSQRMPGININFEVINGGGSNTKSNFEQIKSTERLCFCLLDTDKKHPKSKIGSTAGQFTASNDSASCKHFIIKSHEVESLIPMEIIQEAISQNKLDNSHFSTYQQLNALVDYAPEVKIYFDHKMGITVNAAKELDEKYNDDFWERPFLNAPNFKRNNRCLQNMSCECQNECLAVPGFGTRLLDAGAETLSMISYSKLDRLVPPMLREEWNSIGEQLFSWGCAISQRARSS